MGGFFGVTSKEDCDFLREVFIIFDESGSGKLTKDQLIKGLTNVLPLDLGYVDKISAFTFSNICISVKFVNEQLLSTAIPYEHLSSTIIWGMVVSVTLGIVEGIFSGKVEGRIIFFCVEGFISIIVVSGM